MASFLYFSCELDKGTGAIDFDTDTFWVMLLDAAGVAAANEIIHTRRSDVTGEITGATGYTAGGKVCTITVSQDAAARRTFYTFQAVTWTGFTGTAYGAVYYKRRGGAASADNLVALNDFGSAITLTASPLTIADGIITVQH